MFYKKNLFLFAQLFQIASKAQPVISHINNCRHSALQRYNKKMQAGNNWRVPKIVGRC